MRSGSLGEVRRAGAAFTAEVRGLAHYLQQPKGRLYQSACDADLGDARCGIDLDDPAFRGTGTVVAAASPRLFTASGLDAFAAGWFTRGLVTFTSGANAGRSQRSSATRSPAPRPRSSCGSPWRAPSPPATPSPSPPAATSSFATCKAKFANAANFRGFPHMPGNDFILAVAKPGEPVKTRRQAVGE